MTDTGLTFQSRDAIRWFLRPFDTAVISSGHVMVHADGRCVGEIPPQRAAAFIEYLTRPGNVEWKAENDWSGTYRRVS